ncbi:hypothetical protein Smic_76210 [Streptomyces microflavus]|uniref:Uncharacterized protein n=1 Tax=Streptomyces microflavus TaxID=1919 RepID=A0A7J0D552_STRMI|nr:hypothetical protein Smic_76210 [Streptomyces microflavus]
MHGSGGGRYGAAGGPRTRRRAPASPRRRVCPRLGHRACVCPRRRVFPHPGGRGPCHPRLLPFDPLRVRPQPQAVQCFPLLSRAAAQPGQPLHRRELRRYGLPGAVPVERGAADSDPAGEGGVRPARTLPQLPQPLRQRLPCGPLARSPLAQHPLDLPRPSQGAFHPTGNTHVTGGGTVPCRPEPVSFLSPPGRPPQSGAVPPTDCSTI